MRVVASKLTHYRTWRVGRAYRFIGRFGKQGRGYNVTYLQDELRKVLGFDRTWGALPWWA